MSAPETHVSEMLVTKAESRKLSFYYGDFRALKDINMPVHERKVTALIGPSGCGKSTFLRCFNRMHDLYPGNRYEGEIVLQPDNTNLLASDVDPIEVRMRIGMVFQKPNPFPKTVFENVAYGLRVRGEGSRRRLEEKVETALQDAALWNEVKDRLHQPAYNLSGGQQQRLCIARALATDPELLLFDEPTSALDPIATASIEELMHDLKERVTILIVTHNMQQAARVSDFTAYMYLGDLIEFGVTDELFIKPKMKQTEDYITGRFWMSDHASKQYDLDLGSIRSRVLAMGGLVESQIRRAIDALTTGNIALSDEVIEADHRVNAMEVSLDEDCSQLIVRRQPAAGDLRMIFAIMKTVTDLERIGDEAQKIARMAKNIHERGGTQAPPVVEVRHAAEAAISMLRRTLDCFARLDCDGAAEVIRDDAGIDTEFRSILRQLITYMMEDPRTISTSLEIVWIAKAIERIGDHAKNMAEYVIYIVKGTDVRHTGTAKLEV